ncbi:MAG: tyrosine-type recombinase/integrase [Candidatus Zixiibacteriota bacterium]
MKIEAATTNVLDTALPQPEDPELALAHWAAIYFALRVQGRSVHSQRAIRTDLQKFLDFFQQMHGHLQVEAWTRAVTDVFVDWLKTSARKLPDGTSAGYKPGTINRILANVRTFASFLDSKGLLPYGHPTKDVPNVMKERQRPKSPSKLEVDRLRLAAARLGQNPSAIQAPLRDIAILEVLAGMGLRVAEVCDLRVGQLEKRGQMYWFTDIKRKGQRMDDRPLPPKTRKSVLSYLENERPTLLSAGTKHAKRRGKAYSDPGWLFLSRNGKPLNQPDIVRMLQKLIAEAYKNLPDDERLHISPHQLRHYFAQRYHDEYGDVETARALGHSSLNYVSVYNKRTPEEEAEMATKIDA